jgi:DnaK suppressor protein
MDNDKYRMLLKAKREELLALSEIAKDGRRPVSLDQTQVGRLSRMDALQSQAMSLEIDRRRRQELARIEAALKRLVAGDFGYCLVCGEKIPKKRLNFDPTAAACVGCAGGGGLSH